MMLMAMRLQKTQVPSVYRFTTPGAATFNKAAAVMAGYTSYKAVAIGAAGGRSGTATFSSGNNQRFPSGGGGGSTKIVTGSLSALALSTAVSVGAVGSTGADGFNPAGTPSAGRAGDGGRGGNSTFGALVTGYGGYGGKGPSNTVMPDGGAGANADGSSGPAGGTQSGTPVVPQEGFWDDAAQQGSGGGGGGGYAPDSLKNPQAGAWGCKGGGDAFTVYSTPGEAVQGNAGGGGAAADMNYVTGVASDVHGTGWNTAVKRDGAVAVIVS